MGVTQNVGGVKSGAWAGHTVGTVLGDERMLRSHIYQNQIKTLLR